jgi:hypothetical protein
VAVELQSNSFLVSAALPPGKGAGINSSAGCVGPMSIWTDTEKIKSFPRQGSNPRPSSPSYNCFKLIIHNNIAILQYIVYAI